MEVKYDYLALKPDEIRIAELLPASDIRDIIRCRLVHIYLNDPAFPEYTALSYTWGDAKERASIGVAEADQGDGGKRQAISVTANLDHALRRLRRRDSSIWMWIDAICINQDDLKERSKQAGRMKDIYQKASEVYVWLGEADNNSQTSWKLMHDIINGENLDSTLRIVQDPSRAEHFQALHALFRRPYWTRIWVIQEVNSGGKAVTVHCGEQKISWAELDLLCDRLRQANKVLTAINPNDATMNNALMNGGPKSLTLSSFAKAQSTPSLLHLLYSHHGKYSSDPKDKVYALVGLSTSAKTFGTLDYLSSERDTFIRTAKHIIQTTNQLNVICAQQNDDNKYNLPSWVPDWERRIRLPGHRVIGLHIRQPSFAASGPSKATYSFSDDILKVHGYTVDSVGEMGIPFHMKGNESSDDKILQTLSTSQNWWRTYITVRKAKADTEEFTNTVYGGQWSAFSEPLPHLQRFDAFSSLSRSLVSSVEANSLPPPQATPNFADKEKDYRAMVSSASLRMHDKLFAMSSQQRLSCLVPLDTLKDDFICILFGCNFPVVLRRSGATYRLVGEAYVHGIMNGETMEYVSTKYKVEEFLLE